MDKIIKKLITPQLVHGKEYNLVNVTLYRPDGSALICDIVQEEKDPHGKLIYVIVSNNIFFNENEQPFTEALTSREKRQLGM